MATYTCPKGHQSTDPDYCSECGALIGPSMVAGATPAGSAPAPGPAACPDCGTPRTPGARFCEVCRHDFEAGASSGHMPSAPVEPAVTIAPIAATGPTAGAAAGAGDAPRAVSADEDAAAAGSAPLAS